VSLVDPDVLLTPLTLLAYGALAVVLTAAGLVAEYASLQQYAAGELTVALWLAALGALLLYAGCYAIGYQRLLSLALTSQSDAGAD